MTQCKNIEVWLSLSLQLRQFEECKYVVNENTKNNFAVESTLNQIPF